MVGVDIGDQYRKYYQVRMKSRKHTSIYFGFLMEICSLNAFILHRHYLTSQQKKPPTYLEFRIQLAKQLIGDYNSRKRLGRPPSLAIPLPMEYRCKNSASPPIHRIKWAQCAIAIAIVHVGDISTLLHGHSHFFDSSANKSVCKTSNGGQMDDGY